MGSWCVCVYGGVCYLLGCLCVCFCVGVWGWGCVYVCLCFITVVDFTKQNSSANHTHMTFGDRTTALMLQNQCTVFRYIKNRYFFLPCHFICELTAHNWQKWKRVFLTCPCHKIYRDEAVGLKSCKYTWKITIFVKMWNLGQYRENLIFCQ